MVRCAPFLSLSQLVPAGRFHAELAQVIEVGSNGSSSHKTIDPTATASAISTTSPHSVTPCQESMTSFLSPILFPTDILEIWWIGLHEWLPLLFGYDPCNTPRKIAPSYSRRGNVCKRHNRHRLLLPRVRYLQKQLKDFNFVCLFSPEVITQLLSYRGIVLQSVDQVIEVLCYRVSIKL